MLRKPDFQDISIAIHKLQRRFPPVKVSVPMITKELPTIERFQPYFIEPMQFAPERELPDGQGWTIRGQA